MNGCLQLNSQKWKLWDSDGLKLFLPRQRLDRCIYFQADWSFVPPEMEAMPVPPDASKLRLRLIGYVPGLRDWRDLENLFLGYSEPIDGGGEPADSHGEPVDDQKVPKPLGPDMWIWQPGETKPLRFGHWETDLKFGERRGCEFEFSIEALARSERASKFKVDNAVKGFFGQPETPDWELPEWINEGDEMSFAGRVELREIFCSVPINSAQPVELARHQARRELALEQLGTGSIIDAENSVGKYKPNDGINETGRLVVFPMPVG